MLESQTTKTAVPTDQWELDVYSRPVVDIKGKKLWELLICDSSGCFKHVEQIPSNMINSREVRKAVEKVIEGAEVPPRTIRFFRNAMFNMINIALSELEVTVLPSRTTYSLFDWLDDREKNVYPQMEGYTPSMTQPSIFDIRTPQKLPDALRGERYAFVSLPVSNFRSGEIDSSNVGVGRLFNLDPSLPDDVMIQGMLIISRRAKPLAVWMAGLEVAFVKADLQKRNVLLEVGIDVQFLMAKLDDDQRKEAQAFEKGKESLNGIHFIAVQKTVEADEVEGFWLLRERKG